MDSMRIGMENFSADQLPGVGEKLFTSKLGEHKQQRGSKKYLHAETEKGQT